MGFVGAQSTGQETRSQNQTQSTPQQRYGFGHGFGGGPGRGFGLDNDFGGDFCRGGLPFGGHLALGTTLKLTFYDTDPGAESSTARPTQTLTFTYGQDSEAAFAQSFAEARANAGYLTVKVGEQTQTLELPSNTSSSDAADFGRGDQREGFYGALPLRGLNEGSSAQATFYDGDPEANGKVLQTLNFTYGQDSEAGFADEFASAAQNAAYVTVTTSPQTYTVDLSNIPNRALGRGGFGPDFSGGFGQGDFGRRR